MDMHNRDNNPIRQLKKIKKISMAYSIIDESVTNIVTRNWYRDYQRLPSISNISRVRKGYN